MYDSFNKINNMHLENRVEMLTFGVADRHVK